VSGPSQVGLNEHGSLTFRPLGAYVASQYPEYQDGLPYLLKVLSIRTALSIQAHPDATLAKELHRNFPELYRDPNHKPELAIALTPMDAMSSFRSIPEIVHFLKNVPELVNVIGVEPAQHFIETAASFLVPTEHPYDLASPLRQSLQNMFKSLMTADADVVNRELDSLLRRLPSTLHGADDRWSYLVEMIQTIAKSYPGDVGVFSAFLLNVLRLQPGEAIFLAQNEPHAYLHGDCVECMATSDNVVRAGLTPKFKDVETLVRMLTYKCGSPVIYKGLPPSLLQQQQESTASTSSSSASSSLLEPSQHRPILKDSKHQRLVYAPPVEEFIIDRYCLHPNDSVSIDCDRPAILLCTEGSGGVLQDGQAFGMGSAFFVPPLSSVSLHNHGDSDLVLFRSMVPHEAPHA